MKKLVIIVFLLLGGCSSKEQSTESLTVSIDGKKVTEVTIEYGKSNEWKSHEKVYESLAATCKLAEFMIQFMRNSVSYSRSSSSVESSGMSVASSGDTSITSSASLNFESTDFESIVRSKEAELNIPPGIDYSAPSELTKILINHYKMNQTAAFLHTTLQYDENAKKFLKESSVFKVSPSSILCETKLDMTSKKPD